MPALPDMPSTDSITLWLFGVAGVIAVYRLSHFLKSAWMPDWVARRAMERQRRHEEITIDLQAKRDTAAAAIKTLEAVGALCLAARRIEMQTKQLLLDHACLDDLLLSMEGAVDAVTVLCQQEGLDVSSHLNKMSIGLRQAVERRKRKVSDSCVVDESFS